MSKNDAGLYKENIPACILKVIGCSYLVIGGLVWFFDNDMFSNASLLSFAMTIITSISIYSFGELLQILHDIRKELMTRKK